MRPGPAPLDVPVNQGPMTRLQQRWEGWFRNLAGLFSPNSALRLPAVGGSPFTYQNTTTFLLQAVVTGTVTTIAFSRDGATYYTVTGPVTLSAGDFLKITYPGATPTLILVPL